MGTEDEGKFAPLSRSPYTSLTYEDAVKSTKILKAFFDPTRLLILDLLGQCQKVSTRQIVDAMEEIKTETTLRYHMKVLCEAGIVCEDRKVYSLDRAGMEAAWRILYNLLGQ